MRHNKIQHKNNQVSEHAATYEVNQEHIEFLTTEEATASEADEEEEQRKVNITFIEFF